MICSDCQILGEVSLHKDAVVLLKSKLSATEGHVSVVAERVVLEEMTTIVNSTIESDTLVEIGAFIVEVCVLSIPNNVIPVYVVFQF
jgi:carbonic anhydrase/acetyltransferase-like protein (isoleucine patch superfamily)